MKDHPVLLDLKSVPCPLNVVKCKLALEKTSIGDHIFVELDRGEPEYMVKATLLQMGYKVQTIKEQETFVKFLVTNDS